MAVRIIGLLIIVIACILWGVYMGSKEYFRLSDLREMKRAFLVLRSEIDYGMTPLGEASYNVSQKCQGPVREIFLEFSTELTGKVNVYKVWVNVIESNTGKNYFLSEDIEMLKSFGKTLGYMDKDMQLRAIDMQIDYINTKTSTLEISWTKTGKMYLSLGILGGLAVGILMI